MKPQKHQAQQNNLTQLNQSIAELGKLGTGADLVWFSPIHIRIHFDFGKIDFWPSTGSWYEPKSPLKGKGVKEMMDHAMLMLSKPKSQRWYSRCSPPKSLKSDEAVEIDPESPPW